MTVEDLKDLLHNAIPSVEYFYIQRVPYHIKGSPAYNIFFNTRIPNSKLSLSSVASQEIFSTIILSGGNIRPIKAERPILLDEYSKPILPNSVINFIDLAGDFQAETKGF